MKMKTKIAAAIAAAAMTGSAAFAGFIQPVTVEINMTTGFAQGDMWTARTAMDDVSYIGCGVRSFDDGAGGTFETGFCQARDAASVQVTCFTQNSDLLDTIRLADFSYVTFSFVDDGTGTGGFECTRIGFSTQSFYLPELKTK